MSKDEQKDKYDGDYKVTLSDQGRITLNLNWKWAVGFIGGILLVVGGLLMDKYYFQPMAEKDKKIATLEQHDEDKSEKINQLLGNQKILLDRSDRTQKFIDWLIESGQLQTTNDAAPDQVEPLMATPGVSDVPPNDTELQE